ncbi:MAG: hypothetical protein AB7F59_11660 [Bdellovibrionales bacterium]
MKKFVFILTALLVSMGSQQAQSQAPGYPTQEEFQILTGTSVLYGADVGKGASDGPLSDVYSDMSDAAVACQGVATELRWAYSRVLRNGDPARQRELLKIGLEKALRLMSYQWTYQPLTKRAVQRALQANTLVTGACRTMRDPESVELCIDLETRAANYLVSRFYVWILNSIIPLDTNYYIPYQRDYRRACTTFDCLPETFREPFMAAYSQSAASLLNLYIGRTIDGNRLPEALAKNYYETRVAEFVTRWAAQDLNQDLSRRSYACLIGSLDRTSSMLRTFNAGSRDDFDHGDQAVQFAREEVTHASNWLSSTRHCHRGPYNYRSPF